ncbi:hypothetical protein F4779DRAFT_616055 [Xylariaceae sp. FL0662B]|nr:hypothetical protein F4779DRAFT_616055 [Xylariaceae sp. FL0662B]
MRPCITKRCLLVNFQGLCRRHFGNQSSVTEKLSLILSAKSTKETVIDRLDQHLKNAPRSIRTEVVNDADYGAAILVSREFATWLEDDSFMSSLLGIIFKSIANSQLQSQDIDVLTAVASGIPPKRLLYEPRTGFSILYGSAAKILPGLWDRDSFGANIDQDRESSISFISSPLRGDTRPLEITLPLANTVFQNGRRSTLFASRWQSSPSQSLTLAMMNEKHSQKIIPRSATVNHANSRFPLLPLTLPRKIVAGLGNIVRQLETNGSTTPASKELETLIPKVFDVRSERYGTSSTGPIGVWCWVIPPHVVEAQGLLDLKFFQAESPASEAELALGAMDVFSRLLSSGCRLHKILSGGGGWGLKQGLLSLDPETNYSAPGQDDVEMFIRSFQERNSTNPSEGLVTPGSYLMFCIEPHWTKKDVESSQLLSPTTAIGVAPNNEEVLSSRSVTDDIEIVDGHFGGFSTAGLFLKAITDSTTGISGTTQSFMTKVDTPGACLLI